jgi:hypothetical protein
MGDAREPLLRDLSTILDGRPVRCLGRTLEVFNAEPAEQRALFRRMRLARPELELCLGGPLCIIFHTRRESARLYAAYLHLWSTQ